MSSSSTSTGKSWRWQGAPRSMPGWPQRSLPRWWPSSKVRHAPSTPPARGFVVATGLDTYPDVTVVCGQEERDEGDRLALTNPIVIVEVTSDGTEGYDRGAKLEHYKQIGSVREIVFVSHREPAIGVLRRGDSPRTRTRMRTITITITDYDHDHDYG